MFKDFKSLIIAAIIINSLVIGITVTVFLATQPQLLTGKASNPALATTIYLFPTTINQGVGNSFTVSSEVVGPANKPVSSILLSLHFDKTHLSVNKLQSINFNKMMLLKTSTPDLANSTGVFKILIGAKYASEPPINAINLPSVTFNILKPAKSNITISTTESQVVFIDKMIAELSAYAPINVNSVPTPTPTPSQAPAPQSTISPTVVR